MQTPGPVVPATDLASWITHQAATHQAAGHRRYLFGIAGPPGSGKTTLAHRIAFDLGTTTTDLSVPVVPMDGYHLPNAELGRLGRRSRKGAPDTFAADAFVKMLSELRHGEARVSIPDFDRTVDEPRPDRIRVSVSSRIVIVEGNYLLLDSAPWDQIVDLLDAVAYLDIDSEVRVQRLVDRHVEFGKSPTEAAAFVHNSDERNTTTIVACRHRATLFTCH